MKKEILDCLELDCLELDCLELDSINGGGWISYFLGVLAKGSADLVGTDAEYYALCLGH